jgi:hypothetical protein
MHTRLRENQEFSQYSSDLQSVDFFITQQWMRIVLWKTSMFHIKLTANPEDEGLGLCLPDQAARSIVLCLNTFPTHIVSAAPERLFSSANITISDRRNRLHGDTTEAIECLKSWRKIQNIGLESGGQGDVGLRLDQVTT